MSTSSGHMIFRFRDFELDAVAYELRRKGRRIRLARQPMDLLLMLLERRRELVSRDDIARRLWAQDVFVDVDAGIHTAILRIRQALGDSRDSSLFFETVSGKGYRFVAPVEVVFAPSLQTSPATLAVLPFEWLGGDREREYVANGLTEDTIASLGRIAPDHLSVLGRASTLAYRETSKSLADIGEQLGVDYVVEGTIRSEAGLFRITSKLIRSRDQVQLWSATYDRASAGAEYGDCRVDPTPALRDGRGNPRPAPLGERRSARPLPAGAQFRESADAGREPTGNRLLRARGCSGSDLRPRVGRARGGQGGQSNQWRCGPARGLGRRP